MKINWHRLTRKLHYWGAIVIAVPVIIVLTSGVLLLLKKDIDWIQPPTISGQGDIPVLQMSDVLSLSATVDAANIQTWADINRIDIRPGKGVMKIRAKNDWEIQVDHQTGEILKVAYRRSDFIESIHDGTFFHRHAKLWIFLPASIILLLLWITGLYLFLLPVMAKKRSKKKMLAGAKRASVA